ncbi:hypothetical protein BDF22DRAFT_746476 [Syncephalis plumigaleata]|nr:hypothetical protein BDF22DRAFT_746476 [Syncephalis plumigaleata]
MSNETLTSTAEAMAAAAAIAASTSSGNNPTIDSWVVQEMQRALFSPTAATPLFDSFTSPMMGTTTMCDFMDTPLFNDMDDFPMQADTSSEFSSLFPTSNNNNTGGGSNGNNHSTSGASSIAVTASMLGQAATAAIVAAAANNQQRNHGNNSANTTPLMAVNDMFPEISNNNEDYTPNATPLMAVNDMFPEVTGSNGNSTHNTTTGMSRNSIDTTMTVAWPSTGSDSMSPAPSSSSSASIGIRHDTGINNDMLLNANGAGTKVRALADGSFAVTTKRGTIKISSAQANELLNGSVKRKRQQYATPNAMQRIVPPLGAGGVHLVAPSSAPAPAPITPISHSVRSRDSPAVTSPSASNTSFVPLTNQENRSRSPPEDSMDALALKRRKNTAAAQRSRLRKVLKMEALELKVRELETDNVDLRTKLAVLDNERKGWKSKEEEMREQVRTLERRLDEAHRSLREEISKRRD